MTSPNNERLKIGFYGGKFLPFHIGHAYAAIKALESCDVLYLILFQGGKQEEEIQKDKEKYLHESSCNINGIGPRCALLRAHLDVL